LLKPAGRSLADCAAPKLFEIIGSWLDIPPVARRPTSIRTKSSRGPVGQKKYSS
jgi:hypothetical protein